MISSVELEEEEEEPGRVGVNGNPHPVGSGAVKLSVMSLLFMSCRVMCDDVMLSEVEGEVKGEGD